MYPKEYIMFNLWLNYPSQTKCCSLTSSLIAIKKNRGRIPIWFSESPPLLPFLYNVSQSGDWPKMHCLLLFSDITLYDAQTPLLILILQTPNYLNFYLTWDRSLEKDYLSEGFKCNNLWHFMQWCGFLPTHLKQLLECFEYTHG